MPDQKFQSVTYEAGRQIFGEGDFCGFLYIIKSGQVELIRNANSDNPAPVGIVGSGEYLGELSIIDDQQRHSLTAVALTDVEAISLNRKAIEEQLKSAPPWLVALTKGLVLKLRKTNELVRRNNLVDQTLADAIDAARANESRRRDDKE